MSLIQSAFQRARNIGGKVAQLAGLCEDRLADGHIPFGDVCLGFLIASYSISVFSVDSCTSHDICLPKVLRDYPPSGEPAAIGKDALNYQGVEYIYLQTFSNRIVDEFLTVDREPHGVVTMSSPVQ